jgi:hypothetical protein
LFFHHYDDDDRHRRLALHYVVANFLSRCVWLPHGYRFYRLGHHNNLIAPALSVLTLSHDPALALF